MPLGMGMGMGIAMSIGIESRVAGLLAFDGAPRFDESGFLPGVPLMPGIDIGSGFLDDFVGFC